MMLKHDALSRRLEAMERKTPSPEELEARKHQEFLSKFTVDELRHMRAIVERTDWDRDKMTFADIAFLEDLEVRHGEA